MAPPPSTAASCSWSPASTSLQLFRAAYSVSAARWVDGDHGAFVGHDQRAGRDPALGEVGEEPGGVRGDLDAGRAQFVGGVLGGGGAEHRPVPDRGGGGQDPGLPGSGRPGDDLDGARRGEDVPDGGGLVQPQPARRGVLACVVRAAAQLRLEQRRVGAEAARGQVARAGAARLASARARPACLPGSAARWWRTARRRAGCTRCARPADGAATRAAAAIAGPPGTPPAPVRPDRASSARPSSSSCAACGLICRVSGGMTRASCLTRSCRVQAGCLSETRTRALARARAWASRVGGPVGARPP